MIDSRASSIGALRSPALEHLEHSVCDYEAAEYVCGAEDDGDEAKDLQQARVGCSRNEHRSKHDDAVNRVGRRHERRVKDRWHSRNHFESNEDREDEDVDPEDDFRAHDAAPASLVCTA